MSFTVLGGGRRAVVGRFDGGTISSDGGVMLLSEVEAKTRIIERLAEQFVDHRDPELIEHRVRELIGQRVFALALGYEDLNDHDRPRLDPLLAAAMGKLDPTGAGRLRAQDRGKALASSSTLNRLELTPLDADSGSRYKKIAADFAGIDALMVSRALESHSEAPKQVWLDLDATRCPVTRQPGRAVLPRGDHGLVRGQPHRLRAWPGQERSRQRPEPQGPLPGPTALPRDGTGQPRVR